MSYRCDNCNGLFNKDWLSTECSVCYAQGADEEKDKNEKELLERIEEIIDEMPTINSIDRNDLKQKLREEVGQ